MDLDTYRLLGDLARRRRDRDAADRDTGHAALFRAHLAAVLTEQGCFGVLVTEHETRVTQAPAGDFAQLLVDAQAEAMRRMSRG